MNKTQNETSGEAKDIIENAQIEAQKIINLALKKARFILNERSLVNKVRKESELIKEQALKDCLKIREENSLTHSIYSYHETRYIGSNRWIVRNIESMKYGLLNEKGDFVVPCQYDDMNTSIEEFLEGEQKCINVIVDEYGYSEGETCRNCLSEKRGIMDLDGNFIIEPKYSDYIYFREGLAAVCIIDESRAYGVKYGFIDENDNTIIPFIYDYAQNFINGKARVLLNSEEYFINKNGDRISKKLKREIIR